MDLYTRCENFMEDYMNSFIKREGVGDGLTYLKLDGEKPQFFDDVQLSDGLMLKKIHTYKVVENCEELARVLKLDKKETTLAKLIGLFHDIGRFSQFVKYRTFNDALSENHGALGVKILNKLPITEEIDKEDLDILYFAIANHNAKLIPKTNNKRKLNFTRLIRDCDKIDIYRVLKPYLLPSDNAGVSPDFRELFLRGEQCDYTKMRTQDDRKLVRIMWIYDINFAFSLRKIIKENYVEDIVNSLKEHNDLEDGFKKLYNHIENKLQEKENWLR